MAKSKKRKKAPRHRPASATKKPSPPKATPALAVAMKRYAASIDVAAERKKPRLLSLLFCDFANSTHDKKVNLLGVFDRIFVHPETKQTPVFTLYVRTAETVGERLTVTLFNPAGKPGLGFQFGGEEQTYTPNLPAQIQLVIGLQFKAETEGPYWFDISYKGVSLGGAGLVVEHRAVEAHHGGTDTYI